MSIRKMFVLIVLTLAGAVLSAQEAKFRNVKLMNSDYSIPSETGIIGWSFQGGFKGDMAIVTEDGAKCLKITPPPAKGKQASRAICMNAGLIRAKVGDKVRYELEFKGAPGAKIGFILYNFGVNQWVIWQIRCNGTWQKASRDYLIKETSNKSMDARKQYAFAADVFDKPVLLKSVKVSVQKSVTEKK